MPRDLGRADSPQRWMNNARADLVMARIVLPEGAMYEQLCFFAQQAVEKSIKALLLHLAVDFPFTHNIQLLVNLLPYDVASLPVFEEAAILTPYAVLTRYPGELEVVTAEKYSEAVRIASAVVEWTDACIAQAQ
jgi:HEPN domain-containing protein